MGPCQGPATCSCLLMKIGFAVSEVLWLQVGTGVLFEGKSSLVASISHLSNSLYSDRNQDKWQQNRMWDSTESIASMWHEIGHVLIHTLWEVNPQGDLQVLPPTWDRIDSDLAAELLHWWDSVVVTWHVCMRPHWSTVPQTISLVTTHSILSQGCTTWAVD